MKYKGYNFEAEYLSTVRGWRRACDERGLLDEERSQYNTAFLNYILDDLMPWHKDPGLRNFSILEVNQLVYHNRIFKSKCASYWCSVYVLVY